MSAFFHSIWLTQTLAELLQKKDMRQSMRRMGMKMGTVNVLSLSMTLQCKKTTLISGDFNAMTILYKNNVNCHEKTSNRLMKPNHHLSKQSSPTDLLHKKMIMQLLMYWIQIKISCITCGFWLMVQLTPFNSPDN